MYEGLLLFTSYIIMLYAIRLWRDRSDSGGAVCERIPEDPAVLRPEVDEGGGRREGHGLVHEGRDHRLDREGRHPSQT